MTKTQHEALGETERLVRAGLDDGLRTAVAGLFRVYTAPGNASERDAAFERGLACLLDAHRRLLALLEQQGVA